MTTKTEQKPGTAITARAVADLKVPIASPNNVESLFAQYQSAFQAVAPSVLDIPRMMRVAIMAASRSKDLLECSGISLLGSFMTALQLGLDFGLGECHLVPFKNKYNNSLKECQLIPDYKGLIKLARNSGEISDLWARLVYKGEKFKVIEGEDPRLTHEPNIELQGDSKNIIAAYTITVWKDGRRTFEVINRKKIDRAKSSSASKDSGPWGTDYDEMALKTAFKHRCKTLPRSPQLAQAIALDDRAELARPQNIDLVSSGGKTVAMLGPDDGPEGENGASGDQRVFISTSEQGKFRAWMKKYEWTEEGAVGMLKTAAPGIDFTPQEIGEIVCQIEEKDFDRLIELLEKGPAAAATKEEPKIAEKPMDAKAEQAVDGDRKITPDEYDDLWALTSDAKCAGAAQDFVKKQLGAPSLKSVKFKDLARVIAFVKEHAEKGGSK